VSDAGDTDLFQMQIMTVVQKFLLNRNPYFEAPNNRPREERDHEFELLMENPAL